MSGDILGYSWLSWWEKGMTGMRQVEARTDSTTRSSSSIGSGEGRSQMKAYVFARSLVEWSQTATTGCVLGSTRIHVTQLRGGGWITKMQPDQEIQMATEKWCGVGWDRSGRNPWGEGTQKSREMAEGGRAGEGKVGEEQLDRALERKGGPATPWPRATNYTCPQTGLKTGRILAGFPKTEVLLVGVSQPQQEGRGGRRPKVPEEDEDKKRKERKEEK